MDEATQQEMTHDLNPDESTYRWFEKRFATISDLFDLKPFFFKRSFPSRILL